MPRMSVQLPATEAEQLTIKAHCARTGATIGRVALIALLRYIKEDRR